MSDEQDSNEAMESPDFGPPKSLQGMENADDLWKMITKRFPNAAPLLCEMEAVIDRADDLLRQLRAPCARSVETSSLNNYVDSDEFDGVTSLMCDESFPEDTEVFEDAGAIMESTVETQISESNTSTFDTDYNSMEKSNNNSQEVFHCEEHQREKDNSSNKMNEANSLESWGKLVDNGTGKVDTSYPTNVQNLEEDLGSPRKSTIIDVTKVFDRSQESETDNSSGDSDDKVKENHPYENDNSQENTTPEESNKTDQEETQKIDCKTPWDILEEYAKYCKVDIVYHCEKKKHNHYVVNGKLSEFSATCYEDTEELAKSSMAKKILQNVLDHQMNDREMKELSKLSREQILEILNFGNDETPETPLRKVYMLCVKAGAPPPKYIVVNEFTTQGPKCIAKCIALNQVVEGNPVSRLNAKKAAAEQFCKLYDFKET